MRSFGLVLILLCSQLSSHCWAESKPLIEGDLKIPENYEAQKKALNERGKIIPNNATDATSASRFGDKVLRYHFADILENTKIKPIKSVKNLEKTVNKNAEIDSDYVSIRSKVDVNRLRAELDINTFVNTKFWTENSFTTLRAQMKLFDTEQGLISIENKSNREDSKTYLNFQRTW